MVNTEEIKVLALMPYKFLPAKMGGQKHFALFVKFFSSLIPTICVSVKDNDVSQVKEYEVLNIIENGKFRYANPLYFFTLRKIIKEKKITHLMIEHPYYGWLGILLKVFCKVKLVVRSQNIEAERFKSIGKWWWGILWNYERTTHRFADYNFFIQQDDEQYGITKYKLKPEKCFIITYGFELTGPPSQNVSASAKETISALYNIGKEEKIILFNGSLNYKPNKDALDTILNHINPLLQEQKDFKYRIVVCGSNLDPSYNGLKEYSNKNIIYAGFVDDITLYYKGADMLINPVMDGGGIKTKLVEALGYNLNVVTTTSGAIGVPLSITGDKMKIIDDDNWANFATAVINSNTTSAIPVAFFDHFYWGKIAEKAATILHQK
ncbi:glycosyltransferase [Ferruginibacter sp. SUN106]|uniref:glycosyltransferase n=1 Tax=Ferruginibacter sp. SUN106 TaxID=2978348 RepID=UPI003D35F084